MRIGGMMTQKAVQEKKKGTIATLLEFAGERRALTYVGCALSALAMALTMVPYACIWLVIRDLVAVAPNWQQATNITQYGWAAFGFAVGGIAVYFAALMCTHLAAFRTATNIRKRCMDHLIHTPLGYFDTHASGLLRRRIDGAAAQTETLLAHNLADITGTIAMFLALLVLLFFFDWRMGLSCMIAAVISIAALFTMMGGKNANLMAEYYDALDRASKAGTEYVRGIPVVKVFQQTVYSFRSFKEAIDSYSERASYYQGVVCKGPQAVNLTVTEGAFIFLVPVVLLIAPGELARGNFAGFVTNFAFYAIFSAVLSTALAKIMFAAGGLNQAGDALKRINEVLSAPTLSVSSNPQVPADNSVRFERVSFSYEGAEQSALSEVSFTVEPGQTVALVGPSGGGKTTAASLIPRFWDVDEGTVLVGGVDVREVDPHVLMDRVAFVFQNTHLFSTSILENVRAARPDATRKQVIDALHAAQCDDILAKLPEGVDTMLGSAGTYLSGGEQQRVALARAILKDAPIVVLDEATAFADPENEALIQKAFERLLAGRTVIMIAHRLSTVVDADKIVVLDQGRVAEEGSHEQLVAAGGIYARMWADYGKAAQWQIQSEVA
ncbi:MAG: ABC transporter ATP-binding protein [Coriobacteriales bacterium]|nr:ABC transporter ATP-binding protein [Coriobacteriales bacterium]